MFDGVIEGERPQKAWVWKDQGFFRWKLDYSIYDSGHVSRYPRLLGYKELMQ
jgi:hypothetical protein